VDPDGCVGWRVVVQHDQFTTAVDTGLEHSDPIRDCSDDALRAHDFSTGGYSIQSPCAIGVDKTLRKGKLILRR